MRRYYFPKAYGDVVARLRVPCGFLLAAAFAWFSSPTRGSLLLGAAIALLGLALRAWAAGHLDKNRQLATSGPYRLVRNPLYLGTLIVAAGLVIASRQPGLAVLFAFVFVLVYLPVIEQEEQHLRNLFPEFAAYAESVPMLLPRFGFQGSRARFRWALYWKNREYQAALGLAAGLAYLYWKAGL
jgi:protein-S-isoprenylcysteine O-methyltransferase Ste14